MILAYMALLVLVTAALLAAGWWWRRHALSPGNIGWDDVIAEAQKGRYRLISTEEMADQYLKDPQSISLVDTRSPAEYRAGHIRGAVNLPLTPTWWGRWRSRSLLSTLVGPDKERLVIFY